MAILIRKGDPKTIIETDGKNAVIKAGSTLASDLAKMSPKIASVVNGNSAYSAIDNKRTATADIAVRSLTAMQEAVLGYKSNVSKWITDNFTMQDGSPFQLVRATKQPATAATATATAQASEQPMTEPAVDQTNQIEEPKKPELTDTEKEDRKRADLVTDIVAFCKDFELKPDPRTLDTMKRVSDPTAHLLAYMKVTGYDDELMELAKNRFTSPEWADIMRRLNSLSTRRKEPINQRLIIYFGSAGLGKTHTAQALYPEAKRIVGSADTDPSTLFVRFDIDTKRNALTELGEAMRDGKPIIFDEFNLCNTAVLERLQGVLDNTDKINDQGMEIAIRDGFKVIVTMNLETNLRKTPLPSPLVSRARELIDCDTSPLFANKCSSFIW